MADPVIKLVAAIDEVEAEWMRRTLLAAGIPSVVRNSDALSVIQAMTPPPFSLWLCVRSSHAQAAAEALGLEEPH